MGAAVVVASVLGIGLAALLLVRPLRRFLARRRAGPTRVGPYVLERELGSGVMGTVYLARHEMLKRPAAVKLLHAPGDDASSRRFEREVQLTSQLTHPNTVAVYDYGRTPSGAFYCAMEYLPGITLHQLVERHGAVPPERVIAILVQACGSLEEAHAKGLVHRDITPANLILSQRDGRGDIVKVLDFGLAKDLGDEQSMTLTHADAIAGSPHFLSPEAVRGADQVDARSDLYSLGTLGYYLLTGHTVFDAPNAWLLCMKHLNEKPTPPSQRIADPVPPDLERALMRCLSKRPPARPQTARALAEELEACAAAGLWTDERAAAWWAAHPSAAEEPGDSAPTSA